MKQVWTLPALLFAGLLLAACDRTNLEEQFAQIEAGMTPEEVHELLGSPDEVVGGQQVQEEAEFPSVTELWYAGPRTIAVQYMNNKVKIKTMEPSGAQLTPGADPTTEELLDPPPEEPPEAPGPPGEPTAQDPNMNTPAS